MFSDTRTLEPSMRHSQRNQTSMGLSNTEMETTKLNQKENLVTNRITSPCRSPIDIQPPSQSLKKKEKRRGKLQCTSSLFEIMTI